MYSDGNWIGYHEDSRGLGFLKHARAVLPEISNIHTEPRQTLNINVKNSISAYKQALSAIERLCECTNCKAPSMVSFCLSITAETVIILLWALSLVEFDRNLRISRYGITSLYYRWQSELGKNGPVSDLRLKRLLKYMTMRNLESIVEELFMGPYCKRRKKVEYHSIFTSRGICVFYRMLVHLNPQPEQEKWLQVVPGVIQSESGVQYEQVSDAQDPVLNYPDSIFRSLESLPLPSGFLTNELKAEVIAKETLAELLVSFQFSDCQGSIIGVGPAHLAMLIVWSLGRVSCLQSTCRREAPDLKSVGLLEGIGCPGFEDRESHGFSVVIRHVATGSLAPLAALWTSHYVELKSNRDVILRRDECLPCCVSKGFQNHRSITYIIT